MPVFDVKETPEGIVFKVYVQPRSSKNAAVGLHGDALKLKLTAPPVQGEANRQCTRYLAKCLGLPHSSVEIVSGHASRIKQVRVNIVPSEVSSRQKQRLIKSLESLVNSR